eukprot:3827410-Rhodomonas_salina.2
MFLPACALQEGRYRYGTLVLPGRGLVAAPAHWLCSLLVFFSRFRVRSPTAWRAGSQVQHADPDGGSEEHLGPLPAEAADAPHAHVGAGSDPRSPTRFLPLVPTCFLP